MLAAFIDFLKVLTVVDSLCLRLLDGIGTMISVLPGPS